MQIKREYTIKTNLKFLFFKSEIFLGLKSSIFMYRNKKCIIIDLIYSTINLKLELFLVKYLRRKNYEDKGSDSINRLICAQ